MAHERDPRDVESDPEGKLIPDPSKPLFAAKPRDHGFTPELYVGAREDLSEWKQRALKAEAAIRGSILVDVSQLGSINLPIENGRVKMPSLTVLDIVQRSNMPKAPVEDLHNFLNAAAGDGLICDGVGADDLYVAIFPAEYAIGCGDEPPAQPRIAPPEATAIHHPAHTDLAPVGFTEHEKSAWSLGVEHGMQLPYETKQDYVGQPAEKEEMVAAAYALSNQLAPLLDLKTTSDAMRVAINGWYNTGMPQVLNQDPKQAMFPGAMGNLSSMDSAPKDGTEILAWCDHNADPYVEPESGDNLLTTYGGHAEGLSHAGTGWRTVCWGSGWSSNNHEVDEGSMPDFWFVAGSDFEVVANPIVWQPLPANHPEPVKKENNDG